MFQNKAKNISSQDFMRNISCKFEISIIPIALEGQQKSLFKVEQTSLVAILFFKMRPKNIPSQDFMVINISCKFEKASYNIFFVRAVTVKSLYMLRRWRQRNKVKSIVSTGCYPVDTMNKIFKQNSLNAIVFKLQLIYSTEKNSE